MGRKKIIKTTIEDIKEVEKQEGQLEIQLKENKRITGYINELKENDIFVFGSNTAGKHGKGAAKLARQRWGAIYGQAEGLQGKTYGIPTVNSTITNKLPLKEIQIYIDRFIQFAKDNPNLNFLVTEIGCGLASYISKDIAPLFKEAINVENIYLPESFWKILLNNN